jgi:capsule polysaccharide export protein KpsE/RkpR
MQSTESVSENLQENKSAKFSDYMYILYKWKKFLFVNLIVIAIVTTVIVFQIPPQYKASAVVMIPPESSMGLGGLTSLLGNKSGGMSLGAKLLGGSSASEDVLMGILNSRSTLTNVIERFDLMKYYEVEDRNMAKTIKAFAGDLSFGPNEYSMIEITVINKDPKRAADIANYFVEILDSLNIRLNVEQAKNNRGFIEKRYLKNVADLKDAEDSLYHFQKKYGIFAVPQQLEIAVKAAGEVEANLMTKEISANFIKQQYGENSPQYAGINAEVNLLRAKVHELKNSDKLSSESNVLFPFKHVPDMAMQYLRFYRELEIQSKIMEIILPMFEQAKVEEQKSIPTIVALDKAVPPQLKESPKKAFIIAAVLSLAFFIFILVVYSAENSYNRKIFSNPLQEKGYKFAKGLKKLYRIKG